MKFKELPTTEYLRACFSYDPETGLLTWLRRPREHFVSDWHWKFWNTSFAGAPAGTLRSDGRRHITIDQRRYKSARVIWKWMTGLDPEETIDHRNNDPVDERWANLRQATIPEQMQNTRGYSKQGMPKGVSRAKNGWQSRITANGRRYYLGYFDNKEAARAAYAEAAVRLHGDFANPG